MARDNANLNRLFADKAISKANKTKRLKRALDTCEGRVTFLEKEIARLLAEKADVLQRKAIALDLLGQLDGSLHVKRRAAETGSSCSAIVQLFDADTVRAQFGELGIFDGIAISIGKFAARRRDYDGRVWTSPLGAASFESDKQTGTLSKPADLGSKHATRALECPGYLHAMTLVKTQMADLAILDVIASICATAKVGRLPLSDEFVNMTFDGEVAQRLIDPKRRDAELAWLHSALQENKKKKKVN